MQVIAEPRRQAILDVLREEELPVGELVRRLGMSQPLMSKHLRVLKDAGLVEVRADAQRRLYRIRPEPLAEIDHHFLVRLPARKGQKLAREGGTTADSDVDGLERADLAALELAHGVFERLQRARHAQADEAGGDAVERLGHRAAPSPASLRATAS